MTADKKTEVVEHPCREEGRVAHLLVESVVVDGERTVTGVHCDNPKLQTLDQWQCEWSCLEEVAAEIEASPDQG